MQVRRHMFDANASSLAEIILTCNVDGTSDERQSNVSIRLRMIAFLRVMLFATEASNCARAEGFLSDGRFLPMRISMLSTFRDEPELARALDNNGGGGEGSELTSSEHELLGVSLPLSVDEEVLRAANIDGLVLSLLVRGEAASPRSRLRRVATRSRALFNCSYAPRPLEWMVLPSASQQGQKARQPIMSWAPHHSGKRAGIDNHHNRAAAAHTPQQCQKSV
jgi:hypothetical protein